MKILLLRIYQIFVMAPLLLTITVLAALFTIIATILGGARWWGYQIPKYWARIFCVLSLVRVEVHGRENISQGQSYVFVANHQGAYDIFAIYGYLGHNFRWMMKQSLERIPLVGLSCKVSGHIFVDNSSPAAVKHTMEEAEKRLAGGMSVVVFPEGSRTPDGRLHRFKRGAYFLATEFNLPVVPVTIDGAYAVLQRNAMFPKPGRIILTVHKPVMPGEDGKHDLPELMEQTRVAIASALPEWQR
ncbi:MAG: 1-acyl-sn-glycerol-3-phosphate acyltransferase [Muribaculaceae bacterium]|nr:1-acyl-sn-glycerol-3-phosphate acyltransferase [Muribaculaceae bacterium]